MDAVGPILLETAGDAKAVVIAAVAAILAIPAAFKAISIGKRVINKV